MTPSAELQNFVDTFSKEVCYGIEWGLAKSGSLECKSYYNPQWRIEAVKNKGLDGLYTNESSTYIFVPGQGMVGKAFEKQEVIFCEDLQTLSSNEIIDSVSLADHTAFIRADLAKKFGIHSAVFMPVASGVFEVGSTQKVAALSELKASQPGQAMSPPAPHSAVLEQIVEKSGGACYGIEWTLSCSGRLECKSYYNPRWRVEAVQKSGLEGLYTSESSTYTFLPGEGMVGKAFAKQEILFCEDLQSLSIDDIMDAMSLTDHCGFRRVDLAKKFGIHSAVFMPTANGVLEVGSTNQMASLPDLLSDATAVLRQVISPSVVDMAGLGQTTTKS